jgi:hypothetical protein
MLQCTQPGQEPDLMHVKMSRNSPGINGNLHTVRVETARYGFYIYGLKVGHGDTKRGSTGR